MNTKQLLYVLTLAQAGSFSKAADMLNISQPSLSQYIKKIEKEIGFDLFERNNSDIRVTDAGKIYLEAGRKILDIEHQMENSFTDLSEHKTGSLIIGTAPYRAAAMMPAIASGFQSIYPGMHLVVREGTTAELEEGMEHGEYDFLLTLLPLNDQLFAWEKVAEEELILAVPSSYLPMDAIETANRKHKAIPVEMLSSKRFVMLTEHQYMQKQLRSILQEHQIKVQTAAIVKSLQAQIEFVKAGVGIALVPSGIEKFCRPSEVTFYSFREELTKRDVVILWRKDRKLSVVAKELKKVIHSIDW